MNANNKKIFEILNVNFSQLLILSGKKPKANRLAFFTQIKALIGNDYLAEPETLDQFDRMFLNTQNIDDVQQFSELISGFQKDITSFR